MGNKTLILFMSIALAIFRQRQANEVTLSVGTFLTAFLLYWVQYAVYFIWTILVYPRFFSPLRHFPVAPEGNPIYGHTVRVLREATATIQSEWIDTVPNDGAIRYRMWLSDRLLLTSPKALAEVLVQKNYDFIKPTQVRNGLIRLLGEGILLAEGDEHKRQRKDLMPAFAFRHVKDLYPVFWDKAREMVECLAAATDPERSLGKSADGESAAEAAKHSGAVEVTEMASRATLDIIGIAGMGSDFNSLQDPNATLNVMYRTVFNPGAIGSALAIILTLIPFKLMAMLPIKRNKDIMTASTYIKDLCRKLISQKRVAMSEKRQKGKDIISVALESGSFTDEQLVDQCMTFLAAGHETTATAMTWGMYLLCRHPEVQKKLREEIHAKIPSIDSQITAADIDNCHYLHAVCQEILRVWSPVNLTLRVAACDTSICGRFVPKGTTIILVPWAVNMSTHLWGPDAKEFKPERWLDADGKANNQGSADSNYSFLTFLHGPRSCIGQRFAQAEFACLLAAWAGRFEVGFEEGSPLRTQKPEIVGGITAKPKGGLWVTLKKVDGW